VRNGSVPMNFLYLLEELYVKVLKENGFDKISKCDSYKESIYDELGDRYVLIIYMI
jgi:hypothetical protein